MLSSFRWIWNAVKVSALSRFSGNVPWKISRLNFEYHYFHIVIYVLFNRRIFAIKEGKYYYLEIMVLKIQLWYFLGILVSGHSFLGKDHATAINYNSKLSKDGIRYSIQNYFNSYICIFNVFMYKFYSMIVSENFALMSGNFSPPPSLLSLSFLE